MRDILDVGSASRAPTPEIYRARRKRDFAAAVRRWEREGSVGFMVILDRSGEEEIQPDWDTPLYRKKGIWFRVPSADEVIAYYYPD
jgi:hypothetical protein